MAPKGAGDGGSSLTVSTNNRGPYRPSSLEDGEPLRAHTPVEAPGEASGVAERGGIQELQRARMVAAMSEIALEGGPGAVTVARVVERSGVSRRTFYEHFDDREACLVAAFEQAVRRAAESAAPAYMAAKGGWSAQIRAGLGSLLELFDDEPAVGNLCIVNAVAGQPALLAQRARVMRELVGIVHRGAEGHAARTGGGSGRIVAEAVIGGVFAIVQARLLERRERPLLGLLNQLMSIIVLPYRGPAASARELARPLPHARRRQARSSDPLRGLDMRLTYRTVRTLRAIAEHPAASSRAVADAAGIADQGQVSKLLARLEHLGLIGNEVRRRGSGHSNAWVLTAKGLEVETAIRLQTGC